MVLIRAMRDSNIPKFLEQDLPLFFGIISDLFPGIEVPKNVYPDLERAINDNLELEKMQKPSSFIVKIIQLMETIMVRHGVMLVGQTGCGKTKVYELLRKALMQLHKEGIEDYQYKPV
jgi:dynein heavy chain, axonemal